MPDGAGVAVPVIDRRREPGRRRDRGRGAGHGGRGAAGTGQRGRRRARRSPGLLPAHVRGVRRAHPRRPAGRARRPGRDRARGRLRRRHRRAARLDTARDHRRRPRPARQCWCSARPARPGRWRRRPPACSGRDGWSRPAGTPRPWSCCVPAAPTRPGGRWPRRRGEPARRHPGRRRRRVRPARGPPFVAALQATKPGGRTVSVGRSAGAHGATIPVFSFLGKTMLSYRNGGTDPQVVRRAFERMPRPRRGR